ncbi:MAG: L-2-amino-thiazoline-4-carboxylic acid hydrolase [Gemmatimonadetes bacterium]|jgi:hypothetical protein|nr:L-2-amino-thiazoline-4-carboxylic acid hydrolase [Gemmatimonadota bacterium]
MTNEKSGEFSPAHHALLFAWLSRAIVTRVGAERGEEIVRRATRRYGEERGWRMALRAQAAGDSLSMANYMAYGEWAADPGESEHTVFVEEGRVRTEVHRCPWHKAWEADELMEYGRLYCLEIDCALAWGFNPDLKLEVNSSLSNDDRDCEFVFHGGEEVEKKRGWVMPWPYHVGHLYWTVRRAVVEELGEQGVEVADEVLGRFGKRYGEEAVRSVESYRDTDFKRLPEDG